MMTRRVAPAKKSATSVCPRVQARGCVRSVDGGCACYPVYKDSAAVPEPGRFHNAGQSAALVVATWSVYRELRRAL